MVSLEFKETAGRSPFAENAVLPAGYEDQFQSNVVSITTWKMLIFLFVTWIAVFATPLEFTERAYYAFLV